MYHCLGFDMNIQNISSYTFSFSLPQTDKEEEEIMRRLIMYGQSPTGDKTTDKAKLRRIELQKAKENNVVTGKFLTVSRKEEEQIQEKKKELRASGNPDKEKEAKKQELLEQKKQGAEIQGQQIYPNEENLAKRQKTIQNCLDLAEFHMTCFISGFHPKTK